MIGDHNLFKIFHSTETTYFVNLANTITTYLRCRTIITTCGLTLHGVLNFPMNLSFILALTKPLYCIVTFYPTYCIFQNLQPKVTQLVGA